MSLTGEIKTLLSTVSNVYRHSMPATPVDAVCIYRTGGTERSSSGSKVEEPTFMIKVRNDDPDTGEALCDTIKDLLHNKSTTTVMGIYQTGDVQYLGRNESNADEWTLNFRAYYKR